MSDQKPKDVKDSKVLSANQGDSKAPEAAEKSKPGNPMAQRKPKKAEWTLSRVINRAKRFDSVESWASGAPSSFKAASSHGWIEKCQGFFTKTPNVGSSRSKSVNSGKVRQSKTLKAS